MVDYTEQGFQNALLQNLSPERIRTMDYDAIHILCGKDKNEIDEVFVWEAAKESIANQIENYIPQIEAENGTII